jgi:hypothetical protein
LEGEEEVFGEEEEGFGSCEFGSEASDFSCLVHARGVGKG